MAEKGRKRSTGKFTDTIAAKSAEQGMLLKQDEILDKLNAEEIAVIDSDAGAGGAASEAMTVTGLTTDDTVLAVTQKTAGAGAGKTLIGWSTQANDAITGIWDADPGAGAVIQVLVKRSRATQITKVDLD